MNNGNLSGEIRVASRRDFLTGVFSAGALILGARFVPANAAVPSNAGSASGDVTKTAWNPSVFVGINTDGSVILVSHRSEMGTGIRTTLPMVLADELEADWNQVRVVQADADKKYGNQDTDGSCSIRDFYDTMRQAGATARRMLADAAAAKWKVPVDECTAQNHFIVHKGTGRKLGYGELALAASKQPLPHNSTVQLKKPSEFRYIGKGVPGVDQRDICTGQAIYGFDAHVPGMVFASVERAPVLGGSLKSVDDSQARAVKGVQQIVTIPHSKPPYKFQPLGGVAVVADNTWAAVQGRKKLKIDWESGPNAIFQSETYRKNLLETAAKPQKVVRKVGDVDAAFASSSAKVIEASYYTPLLAHASMEPPAALAHFHDGKVEAWAATQSPADVQETVAAALDIKPEDVTCHVTLLGGAFGRKSKPDYVAEAALISKQVGKPVKISWTREEDLRYDFYHSTSAMYFKAALDDAGKPTAWLQRSVFPPIGSTFDSKSVYGDDEMSMGWIDLPFDFANMRAENGPASPHVRIGWLRSVANVYHAFGVQCFIDELAHAAGKDPVEYWLASLGPDRKLDFDKQDAKYANYGKSLAEYPVDTARLRRVVETVAERSQWSNRRANKKSLGFAAHRSFLTYVAAVVEVEVSSDGKVRIPRVDLAVDCGPVINPDRVKAQFEGASVFGATIALMGEITAADGRVQQGNFNTYPVARMNDAPLQTNVHLIENADALPTGTGEPGVPPMAPAIYNAIFAATGKRLRDLPLRGQKLV